MISVIVPVYNVEKYLRNCLDSIINQTYTDLEIILIDDGSTDKSGAICDEYAQKDARIKVVHKENGGLSSARNVGLDVASGEYVTFIDSDDYIEFDTVSSVVDAISKEHVEIVLIREKQVNIKGETTKIVGDKPTNTTFFKDKDFLIDLVFDKQVNGACDKFYKREFIRDLRFEEGRHHGEDMLFNVCYLDCVKNVGYIDSIKYSYVANEGSVTHSSFNSHSEDNIYFKDKVYAIVKDKYPKYSNILARRCFVARLTLLRLIYNSRKNKQQLKLIKEIQNYLKQNYKQIKKHLSKKEKMEYFLFRHVRSCYFLYLKLIKSYKKKRGM